METNLDAICKMYQFVSGVYVYTNVTKYIHIYMFARARVCVCVWKKYPFWI